MTKNRYRPLVSTFLVFVVGGSLLVGFGTGANAVDAGNVPASTVAQGAPPAQPCDIDPMNVIKYFKESAGSYPWAPVILGHRGLFGKFNESVGGSRDVPENSLASMQSASNACLEGVEMDVRASSDPNTPVITHDSTVGRTTNVFDPRIVPDGQTPPSGALFDAMKDNIIAAKGTNYPANMDQSVKDYLETNINATNAFSPYGEIRSDPKVKPVDGTTYGRNPQVKDLSVETLTNLRLLKYADPAPKPTINQDGSLAEPPTKDQVSTEKIQTVQSLLAYAAEKQIKSAIVFDVLELESLTAITKILAEDTHTFINGRKAKDVVVLKYRGHLQPNIQTLLTDLKNAAESDQYPDGFYPNIIGIVAKYLDKPGGFNSEQYVKDWIALHQAQPGLPLIGLDTVISDPAQGGGRNLIDREKAAGVAIGSFQDVPSYRGGDQYPKELVDKRLYFLSGGTCCRSTDSTGFPDGTPDTRYDYSWMIAGNTTNAIPSGMITSDDAMPIIKTLEGLNLRKKALNAYKKNPVGQYDGKYNQLFNLASKKTLGVGGVLEQETPADQQNDNYRKNNIWAFEWISGETYRIKLLAQSDREQDLYLTNQEEEGGVSVSIREPGYGEAQRWEVRESEPGGFLTIYSKLQGYQGNLAFERDSWNEGSKAIVTDSVWSTQKWQISPLDAVQDLPLNPNDVKKLEDQTSKLRLTIDPESTLLTTNHTGTYFTFPANGDGSYKLLPSEYSPVHPGRCEAGNGTWLFANNRAAVQKCTDWLIIKKPADYQRLMFFNLDTGMMMDTAKDPKDTTQVSLWESNGSNNQAYYLAN